MFLELPLLTFSVVQGVSAQTILGWFAPLTKNSNSMWRGRKILYHKYKKELKHKGIAYRTCIDFYDSSILSIIIHD